jgi:hypothetical protein
MHKLNARAIQMRRRKEMDMRHRVRAMETHISTSLEALTHRRNRKARDDEARLARQATDQQAAAELVPMRLTHSTAVSAFELVPMRFTRSTAVAAFELVPMRFTRSTAVSAFE